MELNMITARKLRDAAIAVLLAIPTLAMTRPVASEAVSPAAGRSPIVAEAAKATLRVDERRAFIPSER
jgi:hypothetical protein